MRAAGVPTPDWVAFGATAFRELGAADAFDEIEAAARPAARRQAGRAARRSASASPAAPARSRRRSSSAFSYDDRVLLERYVDGASWRSASSTASRCRSSRRSPSGDGFDYEARYEIGRTRYVCPAELGDAEARRGHRRRPWTRTGRSAAAGFARVDLMLGEDGPQVLEVNAIPGLTDTCLLPQAAEAAGIGSSSLSSGPSSWRSSAARQPAAP